MLAFAEREPLPERRADLRSAMHCLATMRAAGSRRAKFDHFLPDFDREPERDQSPEEMERALARWGEARKGK